MGFICEKPMHRVCLRGSEIHGMGSQTRAASGSVLPALLSAEQPLCFEKRLTQLIPDLKLPVYSLWVNLCLC